MDKKNIQKSKGLSEVQKTRLAGERIMGQANLFGKDLGEPSVNMVPLHTLGEKKQTEQVGLKPVEGKFITESKAKDDQKYSKAYCMKMIESEGYLWDMRCWDKYKDKAEMVVWLENLEQGKEVSNCGHVLFLIKRMLNRKQATKDEIIEAMLKNPHKRYARRLVKCWDKPELCPKYKAQGDYGNGICDGCE